MAELNKLQRCYHCGALLQTEDPSKEGYISPDIIEKYPEGLLLCNNCYKTEKFSNNPQEATFDEDYTTILKEIRAKKALVVYVVDLFSFEGSFINKIIELLDGVDVLVVANKRDLLPPDVNDDELKEYVAHRLRVAKFKVVDTVITSTSNGYNLNEMFNLITKYSNERDVYFVGASTSGKSALISEFLKQYLNNTSKMIVTYTFDNTHLRGIRIPITNKTYIYETPGTSIDNSILSKVERSVVNAITPKKAVEAKKMSLTKDTCLLFGSLACIELLSKEKTQTYVYTSNKVEVKAHKSIVGDNSKYIANVFSKGSLKPASEKIKSIKDFDVYEFQITEEGDRDIGILGLGWINFNGNKQSFRVYVPKGVYVYTTRSKIKNAF